MSIAQLIEPRACAGIVELAVNTIRTLSIDAVEQARSGHPGTPMALAPLVYTLWNRVKPPPNLLSVTRSASPVRRVRAGLNSTSSSGRW